MFVKLASLVAMTLAFAAAPSVQAAQPSPASSAQPSPFERGAATVGEVEPSVSARGVVFVNTFNPDPNNAYDNIQSNAISGPDTDVRIAWGGSFVPERGGFARTLTLALHHYAGTNEVSVSLRKDANGFPGDVLREQIVQDLPPSGVCCQLTEIALMSGVFLKAGTRYWIWVETTPTGTNTNVGWSSNNMDITGVLARLYGESWTSAEGILPAFKVSGR